MPKKKIIKGSKKTPKSLVTVREVKQWSPAETELIKNTIAIGATDNELKLFLYTCSRTGLDPLTHQIYFIKRKAKNRKTGNYEEKMTIQTGIDGYRAIAEKTRTLAGIDDAVYDSEDKRNPAKATVTVYRMVNGEKVSFTASARWSEYAPTGSQAFMWNRMPYLMLAKCAESLALRKAFPNDLSGLYTNEEMAQRDNVETKLIEPKAKNQQELIKTVKKAIAKMTDPDKVIGVFDNLKESQIYTAQTKKILLPKIQDRIDDLIAKGVKEKSTEKKEPLKLKESSRVLSLIETVRGAKDKKDLNEIEAEIKDMDEKLNENQERILARAIKSKRNELKK